MIIHHSVLTMDIVARTCVCIVVVCVLSDVIDVSYGYRCENITVPLCRGFLPYNQARIYSRMSQGDIFTTLDQWSVVMEDRCSNNFRLWVCGALLPECETGYKPCRDACTSARKKCKRKIKETRIFGSKNGKPRRLPNNVHLKRRLKCSAFKRNSTRNINRSRCILSNSERTGPLPPLPFNYCEENTLELCAGLPFNRGSLPNMFRQTLTQVETEIESYRDFIETGCHPHVRLFVCGVYKPFCPTNEFPVVMPCQGLCDDVMTSCDEEFQRLFPGGPRPTKLQCHRYPVESSQQRPCFDGSDANPVWGQGERAGIE